MATADEFAGLRPIDKGDRYQCPWEKWKRPGALDLMKWKFHTKDNSKVPKTNQVNINKNISCCMCISSEFLNTHKSFY